MELNVEGVMAGLVLAAIVLTAEVTSAERKPYGSPSGIDAMTGVIEEGRKVAASTLDGVTIEVTPLAGDRAHVELHLQRPTPTATVDPTPQESWEIEDTVSMTSDAGASNGAPFAIFISPHNAASAAVWVPADGALATEPTCVNPITLIFQNDGTTENMPMSCSDATIASDTIQ